jgi:predicted nucleic acid-binding protein
MRDNRQDFLDTYAEFFDQAQFISLDRAVFEKATELRVQHRLKTPDALHLAAALYSGCSEFWTNDLHLVNAASGQIAVVDWDKLLAI